MISLNVSLEILFSTAVYISMSFKRLYYRNRQNRTFLVNFSHEVKVRGGGGVAKGGLFIYTRSYLGTVAGK